MIALGINSSTGLEIARALGSEFILCLPKFHHSDSSNSPVGALLAHGSSNEEVGTCLKTLIGNKTNIPFYASVFLPDPFVHFSELLLEFKSLNVRGISNFPSIGFYDGRFRQDLEATGFSFPFEAAKLKQALDFDLDVIPFISSVSEFKEIMDPRISIYIFNSGIMKTGGPEVEKDLMDTLEAVSDMFQGKYSHSTMLLAGWILEDPALFRDIRRKTPCCSGLFDFAPSSENQDLSGFKSKIRFLSE